MSALLEKLQGVANAPGLRPQAAEKRHDLKISVCQAPGSGTMVLGIWAWSSSLSYGWILGPRSGGTFWASLCLLDCTPVIKRPTQGQELVVGDSKVRTAPTLRSFVLLLIQTSSLDFGAQCFPHSLCRREGGGEGIKEGSRQFICLGKCSNGKCCCDLPDDWGCLNSRCVFHERLNEVTGILFIYLFFCYGHFNEWDWRVSMEG